MRSKQDVAASRFQHLRLASKIGLLKDRSSWHLDSGRNYGRVARLQSYGEIIVGRDRKIVGAAAWSLTGLLIVLNAVQALP